MEEVYKYDLLNPGYNLAAGYREQVKKWPAMAVQWHYYLTESEYESKKRQNEYLKKLDIEL